MIRISHLSKVYPGGVTALRDISLEVRPGEVISVIGPSGCGKSTLVRCIEGLEAPSAGTIETGSSRLGMVFQQFNVFPHLSVLDNVTLGPVKLRGIPREEAEQRGMELLRTVGLAEKARRMPDSLSGGQKQRVGIARCLSMDPDVLLFDEPTSALDQTMKTEVFGVISELAKQGMTMVIVTHELEFARKVSTRVLFMHDGEICEEGTPEQVFDHPQKTLTQIFIRNRRSLIFQVDSREYDLYKFNADIEWFCQRNHLGKKYFTLELITEELLTHFLPFSGPIHFRIYLNDEKKLAMEIEQESCSSPIVDSPEADEISLMILQGLCASIRERQEGASRFLDIVVNDVYNQD
ncbi:MAG: amino acid ABC transporter ATP-binding protein [Bacteroidales bacterium]|jgi:polar amino acid transport system ATP-binding protein|nr:amino acid ABC transporter ATP-binding protein [Bacteroidales bacterium]MCR5571297.1 amino acid ABC transporter ATP-binding protein [Bacteroidales bacterium]